MSTDPKDLSVSSEGDEVSAARALILARRNRLMAAAVAGLGVLNASCADDHEGKASSNPCLSYQEHPDAGPTACLTIDVEDAGPTVCLGAPYEDAGSDSTLDAGLDGGVPDDGSIPDDGGCEDGGSTDGGCDKDAS